MIKHSQPYMIAVFCGIVDKSYNIWDGGDQCKLDYESLKDDLNQSRYRINCCNREVQNYKGSKNMVVWVVFSSFSCNRQVGKSSVHLCFIRLYTVPSSFRLIVLPFARMFCPPLNSYLHHICVSTPGKGEREVECKKYLKDLVWKMRLLFPFISLEPSHIVTPHCCQGSCKFRLCG